MESYTFRKDKLEKYTSSGKFRKLIILPPVDGISRGKQWGRIHMDFNRSRQAMILLYAAASDYPLSPDEALFEKGRVAANSKDVLLYSLKGRYLYLQVRIFGEGDSSIDTLRIMNPGDRFMNTFPEIYRSRNSIFHRYISIFSSRYDDFGEKIETVDRFLDIDTAGIELLEEYARWLGIRPDMSFKEDILRELIKNAYELNRRKGTAWAIRKIVKIVTGYSCKVYERSQMRGDYSQKEQSTIDRLYGDDD